jgi:16S rRNA (cytosine967-C5)-methyltransferase
VAAPAREAAYRVLRAVSAGALDLGEALHRARDPLADPRDRALATELAVGTLRWRGALDYQLQRVSGTPLDALDRPVLDALRLGAYQLLYLQRVPPHAAVHDTVGLVRKAGFPRATGFVNAVLRRLSRERDHLPWPDRSNLVEHLAVVHSHPAWLVARWLRRYGEAGTEQWLHFNNTAPALTLAANRLLTTRDALKLRLEREGVVTRPTDVAPAGLVVESGQALATRAFEEGLCLVQDEASQLVPELLLPPPGARILDLCAAPGGKTIAAAAQCGPSGLVVATDIRRRRLAVLADTLVRCRAENTRVIAIPPEGPLPFQQEVFDRVLIDAPCSGLGTLRRDPDIRWRRRPEDLVALARIQLSLLERVQSHVRPGGWIVYSTCSSEPEENEHVVTRFLSRAPAFALVPLSALDVPPAIGRLATPEGYLRTSPLEGLEAFFAAVIRRTGPEH